MDDTFDKEFGVWPERAFILLNGTFEYVSLIEASGAIDWEKNVDIWLDDFVHNNSAVSEGTGLLPSGPPFLQYSRVFIAGAIDH